jgi:hypothetical protein
MTEFLSEIQQKVRMQILCNCLPSNFEQTALLISILHHWELMKSLGVIRTSHSHS